MTRSIWRSLPSVMRLGLILAAFGVFADLTHHIFAPDLHAGKVLHIGFMGHVLTLVGMVIALSSVVRAGASSRRRARERGGSNAAYSRAAATR
jgi:hypothetical protein